jgi:TM2 domain-containing membrane protein YozV
MTALAMIAFETGRKSTGFAYLLWFVGGALGLHRLYAGRPVSGAMQAMLGLSSLVSGLGLLLLAALGLWLAVDGLLIAGWIRRRNLDLIARLYR